MSKNIFQEKTAYESGYKGSQDSRGRKEAETVQVMQQETGLHKEVQRQGRAGQTECSFGQV